MKKKVIALTYILVLILITMTGCGSKNRFYTDRQVNSYVGKKFPGSRLVSEKKSDREDVNKIYTYEDEYGRKFFVTSVITYGKDLSGKEIGRLANKKIQYSYEKDIMKEQLPKIRMYLIDEKVDYRVNEGKVAIVLQLSFHDRNEDTVRHAARVFSEIDSNLLKLNIKKEKIDNYYDSRVGYCSVWLSFDDPGGGVGQTFTPYNGLELSFNPSDRWTEERVYDFFSENLH